MKAPVILDTGPLVAFLSHRDVHHDWVTQQMAKLHTPLLTCEAVISEACFVLRKPTRADAVVELVKIGLMTVPFHLEAEREAVQRLLVKYANVPMSFADACLVRMSELYSPSTVLTLDSDFLIYRRHKNQPIVTLMPFND